MPQGFTENKKKKNHKNRIFLNSQLKVAIKNIVMI